MPQSNIKGLQQVKLLTIEASSGNHFFPPSVLPKYQTDKRQFPHSGKRSAAKPEPYPMAAMRAPCLCNSGRPYRACCSSKG